MRAKLKIIMIEKSHAILLPKILVENMGLKEGDNLIVSTQGKKLTISNIENEQSA